MSATGRERGALAIVLHTHMPYVEGFGTWPFGEEWLWEAIACCYLPLLDLLDSRDPPVTLSLTPVLADQLDAPGLAARFHSFIEDTRRLTHAEDASGLRAAGDRGLAGELERAWRADYERARERLDARGGDLLGAFAAHARWTSTATHAVLPLLATDACTRLQVETGIASHRDRFGDWHGGFWLPECAHAPHLEPILAAAGVHGACVELTRRHGLGAREHLRPLLGDSGVALLPINRATISLVWSDAGYPADGAYRDYHHHTVHHHNPWRNDGGAYDHALARSRAREHAADFVARTRERLRRDGEGLPGGGLAVCALDTELLGHWWYEGVAWLEAVIEECAGQGLELVRLDDDALERFEPAPVADLSASGRRRRAFRPAGGLGGPIGDRQAGEQLGAGWGPVHLVGTGRGGAGVRHARGRARGHGRRHGRDRRPRGGARAAGAAGQRLAVHGLPRSRRPLRPRALRRSPRRARPRAGGWSRRERGRSAQPRGLRRLGVAAGAVRQASIAIDCVYLNASDKRSN